MHLSITKVNRDKGYIFDRETQPVATKTGLFLDLSRQFGRCCSKMYIGNGKQIGWVFEKKEPYDDNGVFIQETWVELVEYNK